MIHFQCYVCGITATCVHNTPAELAWYDHMETHARRDDYGSWTWTVVTLFSARAL